MPDLYDRATCATELRLMGEITPKIREGRKPAGPFGVPNSQLSTQPGAESSEIESATGLTADSDDKSDGDISDLSEVCDADGSKGFA